MSDSFPQGMKPSTPRQCGIGYGTSTSQPCRRLLPAAQPRAPGELTGTKSRHLESSRGQAKHAGGGAQTQTPRKARGERGFRKVFKKLEKKKSASALGARLRRRTRSAILSLHTVLCAPELGAPRCSSNGAHFDPSTSAAELRRRIN